MRFAPFLIAALGLTSASAAVLEQRALLDLCANVVGQLNIALPLIGLVGLGQVNICLCVSALPLYVRTNVVGRAIVKLLGSDVDALAHLNALLGSRGRSCQYPTHATPRCSAGDPCDFDCGNGYVRQGSSCVCSANAVLCNGECKPAGTVCGSLSVVPRSISTWMDAQCKRDKEVCGVLNDGLIVPRGFECIDTRSHKESCGGCVLPIFAKQKRGQDCTSIIGARDVSCIDSTCVMHTCKDGFVVSGDESTCLPVLTLEGRDTTVVDTVAGSVPVYIGGLASSVNAASRFATKVVSREATPASTLSLGKADTVLNLDSETLASLIVADDPFAIVAAAYTAAHAHAHAKREANPTPITPSGVYLATGMEGLVLVDSL